MAWQERSLPDLWWKWSLKLVIHLMEWSCVTYLPWRIGVRALQKCINICVLNILIQYGFPLSGTMWLPKVVSAATCGILGKSETANLKYYIALDPVFNKPDYCVWLSLAETLTNMSFQSSHRNIRKCILLIRQVCLNKTSLDMDYHVCT